ncbi:MAG: hypothetical protein KF832_28200 [Caldilineaceae bacterium]|nr:hypothetical protein [Caldilineaceae bacterium]
MAVSIKPLTHWVIYKGYKLRFTERIPTRVKGVLTTDQGEIEFTYDPLAKRVSLPTGPVVINDYGWEVEQPGDDSHEQREKP